MKLITDRIKKTFQEYPNNIAITYLDNFKTYRILEDETKKIASGILKVTTDKVRVCILTNRNENIFSSMLGVLFSGNSYAVLDSESPSNRLNKIIDTLEANIIIYDDNNLELVKSVGENCIKLNFEELLNSKVNDVLIERAINSVNPKDMAFSIFTSGSTGNPKGVIITHENLINYQNWFINEFEVTEETNFGAQAPIYFSISCSDTFGSLFTGATYNIIPKMYFTFPVKLLNMLNDKKINFLYMVPTAIGIMVNLDLFHYVLPKFIKRILFAGEAMPAKYVSYLQKYLPNAKLTNMFGPTETVDICCFYNVNRTFEVGDNLPIGKPTGDNKLYIVDSSLREIKNNDKIGELYVSGSFVTAGYYNNPEATSRAFIKDLFNNNDDTIYYKTGDLVKMNSKGELLFMGRSDNQIKHLGNRIELGEVERAYYKVDGLQTCISLYLKNIDSIYLLYVSKSNLDKVLNDFSMTNLPEYMRPQKYIKMNNLPLNQNGKIDRKTLTKIYENEEI